ncbi:CHAT domain-containing protein [Mycena vulgaris]|nr:CHAT domain-containing protein [Mycena vulgaris]
MVQLVEHTPRGDPELLTYQELLGEAFRKRYLDSGNLNNLEAAIHRLQQAADLAPLDHPTRAGVLQALAMSLTDRYRRSGNLGDLEASLKMKDEVLDLTPRGHPDRAQSLSSLAASLGDRYWRLGDLIDLEMAIQKFQEALALTPEDHPARAGHLRNLATASRDRYRRGSDLKNLETALRMNQEAVELTPEDHPARLEHLQTLGGLFTDRYHRLGNLEDLETAVQSLQEAVDLTTEDHPDRAGYLHNLATSFRDRYQRTGDLKDLEASLQKKQEALELTPDGHPHRAGYLQSLAASFEDRYYKLNDLMDIEKAMQKLQEVVNLTREQDPDRAIWCLHSLALLFSYRYQGLGDLKDLEDSERKSQEAVDLYGEKYLRRLATSFNYLYPRFGDPSNREIAMQKLQEAVDLTPEEHPAQAGHLRGLALSLQDRYRRLGNLKDLEVAVQKLQEAVVLIPEGHSDRAEFLQGLGAAFGDRYRRLGDLRDLEMAMQKFQEVVDLTREGHPNRAWVLRNVAVCLQDRYRRLGDLRDLEKALQNLQEAVDVTRDDHPDRAELLFGLATGNEALWDTNSACFSSPNHRKRDDALVVMFEAMGTHWSTDVMHYDKSNCTLFGDRYERLGDLTDLEIATQKSQEAVDMTPEEHPARAGRLNALAASFIHRYRMFREPQDLKAVHTMYIDSFKQGSSSLPEQSWFYALQWAAFAEEFEPSYSLPAYRTAFHLLPELLWISYSIPVRHEAIHRLDIVQATSNAARTCIELSDLESAVELIEQGVATIFQQMLELKPDVKKLQPDQAQKLLSISSELYSGKSTDSMQLANDRNDLLESIRIQPGLEYFLLPKPYDALRHASQGGPVVILSSHRHHCDVIIIANPTLKPIHVPLPNVTLDLLESHRAILKELLGYCNVRLRRELPSSRLFGQRERFSSKTPQECFADMLAWLWTHHGIDKGRLWWLPTGAFAGLPLHASPPTDEFIHSYTATIGALIDAHAKKSSSTAPKFVVVGVTHTGPGDSKFLKGVVQEVKRITSIIGEPHLQCLEGEKATVDAVKLQLEDCSWAHLACHGSQNLGDPTKSHLQLYGGVLELETILRMPLSNAQFVFLAACQTAMGDAELVNESFHLGGGFIAAGFRGAIGTMWSMNDADGPLVAESVYSHLFRKGQQPQASNAAEALQLAVKELKKRKVPYERWIPFIHMGV